MRRAGVAYDLPYFAAIALGGPDACRSALGDERYNELFAEGATLDREAFAAYVLRGRGRRGRPSTGWDSLTPTERRVVDLVVDGLNQQIADKLFMSLATVKSHLTHVYTKLGSSSRAALSATALAQRQSADATSSSPLDPGRR